jgi:ADP-dependent phosphofructokinase/glucokinase
MLVKRNILSRITADILTTNLLNKNWVKDILLQMVQLINKLVLVQVQMQTTYFYFDPGFKQH